jgi:hypothetical protein
VSKPFLITFAAVSLIILGLVWTGFVKTAGNHLAPTGTIGKVRTVQAADDLTFMVLDFNVKNGSDRNMIVRIVEASVDTSDGRTIMGSPVAGSDIDSAFKSYPFLGPEYNPVLKERDVIPAHGEVDRMVGIRFDSPAAAIDGRKNVTLRLWDVTGAVVELKK